MATRTITNGGGAWNVAGTWVEGVVPTAADDVVATITSGNLSIPSSYTALCRSINLFGFTGTFTHATGSAALTIGTSTPGPSNVALFFPTSLTYTNGTSTITFNSTSTTQQTIDFGGKTPANWAVNASGGSYILGRNTASTAAFTLTAGTFDTGNYAVSVSSFSVTGSPSKTLTLGSSAITLTGAGSNIIYASTSTNLTISANTSTWSFNASGGNSTILGGGYNWGGASLVIGAAATGGISHNNIGIWKDYTRTGGALRVDANYSFSGTTTFTGVLTLTGNSEVNRIFAQSGTVGTPAMITAAAVSLTNVDFMDIAMIDPASTGTVVTSDSFNRSNGLLAGSTADAAGGGSTAVWESLASSAAIVSNKLTASGSAQRGYLPVGSVDQIVSTKVVAVGTGTASGLYGRVVDGNNLCYVVFNNSALYYGALVAGVETYTQIAGVSLTTDDVLTLGLIGNVMYVKKNSTIVYTGVMPTSWPRGTKAGVQVSSGSPGAEFDDFEVKTPTLISGTSIGDAQGNSGITFTTPVDRYAVAPGNWTSTSMWAATSGGSAGASVPLPQDNVFLDANSAAGTYTMNAPRMGKNVDCTGFTRTLTETVANTMYGSLTLVPGMTYTIGTKTYAGRGSHTVTTAGKSLFTATVSAPGGTYTMADAYNFTTGDFALTAGTWVTAGYTMTASQFTFSGTLTRVFNATGSILNATAAFVSNFWNVAATNLTLTMTGTTIVLATPYTGNRNFLGGGFTYDTVTYTVANSPGTLAISGANVIGTLNIGPGRTVTGNNGVLQTIGNLNATGQNNGYLYIRGGSGDYAAVPDAAQNQITGDIDIRVDMAPDSWTAGTAGAVMGKDSVGGAGRVWQMGLTAAGFPTFTWWDSGGTLRGTHTASAAAPFTGNTRSWLRVTLDVDNGSGGHALKFWTSPAGTPVWTQLGSTISAGAFTTSMRNQSALVAVGSAGGGGANPAKFYRAQIRNNILDDGTGIVLDMDFTAKPFGANTFTESSTNAAVVTLAGNAIVGDGRVALASGAAAAQMFLSLQGARQTFNYLTVRDVFSTVPYKFYAGANSVDVSGNTNVTFTAAPVEPYLAFDAEAILVIIGTGGTLNLVIPPGQAVLPGDTLVFVLNTINDHGTAAVSGYTPITPAKVMDAATAISVLTKTAVGGESSATWTSGNGSAGTPHLMVVRGLTDTLVDVVDSAVTGGGSPASSITTGSGVTNTAVPALALALWAANGTMGAFVSVSNGFQISRLGSADTGYYGRGAVKPLSSVASQTSTLTWASARRAVGRMVVLKSTPTGNQAGLLAFFP